MHGGCVHTAPSPALLIWSREGFGIHALERIGRVLASRGHDTSSTRLALFSGACVADNVRSEARKHGGILLDLRRPHYGG